MRKKLSRTLGAAVACCLVATGLLVTGVPGPSQAASLREAPPDKPLDSHDVWKDMAHAIFNMKEFIYLR